VSVSAFSHCSIRKQPVYADTLFILPQDLQRSTRVPVKETRWPWQAAVNEFNRFGLGT
jgi:hypothetical protein